LGFSHLVEQQYCSSNTLLIGCLSYEERCLASINILLNAAAYEGAAFLFDIDDDECTHLPWKTSCNQNTHKYWVEIEDKINTNTSSWQVTKNKYRMSKRTEHVLALIEDIDIQIKSLSDSKGPIKCILDVTCIPSYFALQLFKALLINTKIKDFIVLYTKPKDYPEEILKISPYDKTSPDFLRIYGNCNLNSVKWIVGVGFDNDSVKNALRIKEQLRVDATYLVVPFPGYRPEYVVRSMTENSSLLQNNRSFHFAQADNPFRSYKLICEIVNNEPNFILSTFGTKPMAIGFAMAAIKLKLPILHVQATNYNPNFSTGIQSTSAYWIKYDFKNWE